MGNPLLWQPRGACMRREINTAGRDQHTPAYTRGYRAGIAAPSANCSPSAVQREENAHCLTLFMQGWNAGQRATDEQIERYQSGDDGETLLVRSGVRA